MTIVSDNIRKTDAPFTQPIQTSRYLEINDDWFFFPREKDLLGPYRSRRIAEHAVNVYIDKIERQAEASQAPHAKTIDTRGALDSKTSSQRSAVREQVAARGKDGANNVVYFKDPSWDI